MGFQLSHIIIPVIPGELVQIAGGYIYGTIIKQIFDAIGNMFNSAFDAIAILRTLGASCNLQIQKKNITGAEESLQKMQNPCLTCTCCY